MFTFTKKFWHNSKSQRGTLLLANFVNFIIIALIASLIAVPYSVLMHSFYMSAMMGQANVKDIWFILIAFFVLTFLLFIFLIYPLLTGSVRTFYHAFHPEKHLKFTDLFNTFTGSRWLKAVKLAILVFLMFFLVIVLSVLLSQLFNLILEKLIPSPTMYDPNILLNITIQLIISFLLSIVTWWGLIFIINMTTAYVEDPQRKIIEIIKLGWKAIFNKQKTFLKFFIGILIINLLFLIVSIPGNYYQFFLGDSVSLEMLRYIDIIISIIYALIRFLIYLVITGTAVQYFMNFGKKEA